MRVATLERERLARAWTDTTMLATPLFVLWLDQCYGVQERCQRLNTATRSSSRR